MRSSSPELFPESSKGEAKERQGQRNDLNLPQIIAEGSKGESAVKAAAALKTSATCEKAGVKIDENLGKIISQGSED